MGKITIGRQKRTEYVSDGFVVSSSVSAPSAPDGAVSEVVETAEVLSPEVSVEKAESVAGDVPEGKPKRKKSGRPRKKSVDKENID